YALLDKVSLPKELSTMFGGGVYPGMITATVGTAMLVAVVATSIVIVRRRLRYEWWYAVHLLAYGGIALAWFHQIPTGNELVLDTIAADYGRSLRITVKALGDDTARIGAIPVGTRVVVEGPFGVFTEASRTRERVLLIAGGIGITPVRALLQQMDGDVVALYRVVADDDVI